MGKLTNTFRHILNRDNPIWRVWEQSIELSNKNKLLKLQKKIRANTNLILHNYYLSRKYVKKREWKIGNWRYDFLQCLKSGSILSTFSLSLFDCFLGVFFEQQVGFLQTRIEGTIIFVGECFYQQRIISSLILECIFPSLQ